MQNGFLMLFYQINQLAGRHLSKLPLDPNIGKMLLMGSIFQCLDSALTIAATLAYRSPFVLPITMKEEADAVKRSFAGDSCRQTSTLT
jgi:ATP-dependent RNA helicase DHX36